MRIRDTTEADLGVFLETAHAAFGLFLETPTDEGGLWWSALEMDRGVLACTDDGRPVGTAGAYSFELTLPGPATVPVGGVTSVAVLPSHRRQGVLTAMMRHQLTALRARGEAMSVLLCSEAGIYRRFGYGPATYTEKLTVTRGRAAFTPPRAGNAAPVGSVEVLDREKCGEILEDVYDRYRRARPGALSRPHLWWTTRAGQPPISKAPRYAVVHRDADGTPDGYATYVREQGTLTVDEVIALDDATATAISQFLLGHDLVSQIEFKRIAADDSLRWQLADFRAAQPGGATDWLWLRLLDVPEALTARGWEADGELVLDVDDPFLGEHSRYLLTVRDGKPTCVPTDQDPDMSLDISDLGSIYLGGTVPSTLVRAGHIRAHHPTAAARADLLFRAERPPYCVHWF